METRTDLSDEFWELVDKSDPCWVWRNTEVDRQPTIKVGGKNRTLVRYMSKGVVPGKNLKRTCINEWCINPAHYYYK